MKRRTKIIIGVVIATILVVVLVARSGGAGEALQTSSILPQDLTRTVLATGTVTSSVDLELGFKGSGIVRRIPVKVGQKVTSGAVLMQLDQADQAASVAQARASVASAEASLKKVLSGATSEEVTVAQVTLDNAKRTLADTISQQAVSVKNSRQTMLSAGLVATPAATNVSGVTVGVSGSYTDTVEAVYSVRLLQTGSGWRYEVPGADGLSGSILASVPLPATKTGLFITFSAVPAYANDVWTVEVPNTKSTSYLTNLNLYTAALEAQRSAVSAAESAVGNAEAVLALKKAQARPADVAAAEAGVLSARAQLAAALAQLENTIIRSPSNGTVTKVGIKVGEQATGLKPIITLQDVGSLYVEVNISEANIAQVVAGQAVTYTFDALGPDRVFSGTVTTIDPASTVVSGVVNYKVTAAVSDPTDVRPGMTANMSILVGKTGAVLAVPQRSLIEKGGKKFVRVITNEKKQIYSETEVTTGLEADGGLVEIKSGLSEGQVIVTFIEPKK